jgi:hypothetical protein
MTILPDSKTLNIMWAVATSTSLETGTRPHLLFAKMLYDDFTNKKPPVTLYDDTQREKSITQNS